MFKSKDLIFIVIVAICLITVYRMNKMNKEMITLRVEAEQLRQTAEETWDFCEELEDKGKLHRICWKVDSIEEAKQ